MKVYTVLIAVNASMVPVVYVWHHLTLDEAKRNYEDTVSSVGEDPTLVQLSELDTVDGSDRILEYFEGTNEDLEEEEPSEED